MLIGTPCKGPSDSLYCLLCGPGIAPRLLVHDGAKAIQQGIGLFGCLQQRIDILDRRKLPGADEGGDLGGWSEQKVGKSTCRSAVISRAACAD